MELTLLLLIGLLGSIWTQRTPPRVVINLDKDPQLRWMPLRDVYDVNYLRRAAVALIDSTVPKWVHEAAIPIVKSLEKYIPQPYAGELRGMASALQADLSDVMILNLSYEFTAFCTSIVAQDRRGNVYHGRNFDYKHPILRNLTVNIVFLKNGKLSYQGTSFAGYIGLWTGQSPYKFTISGDQRGSESWWNWWRNIVSALLFHRNAVSWVIRKTLEEAEDFQDAVTRLSKTPLITRVYYIVGGTEEGEGAIITRDRKGPADVWHLEPVKGGWYRVETNFDHWLPPPPSDHRREVASKALHATGQDHINMDKLYKVLSLFPVCNGKTIYTTVMSAASPEKYITAVRPKGCSRFD